MSKRVPCQACNFIKSKGKRWFELRLCEFCDDCRENRDLMSLYCKVVYCRQLLTFFIMLFGTELILIGLGLMPDSRGGRFFSVLMLFFPIPMFYSCTWKMEELADDMFVLKLRGKEGREVEDDGW